MFKFTLFHRFDNRALQLRVLQSKKNCSGTVFLDSPHDGISNAMRAVANAKAIRVALVHLGCARNLIDSETILGRLPEKVPVETTSEAISQDLSS